MKYQRLFIVAIGLLAAQLSWAQSNTKDDVRFFEHFFNDAAVVTSTYVEGVAAYGDYDAGSSFVLGAQGGIPVSDRLDAGARWAFANRDWDYGGSESGLTDIELWGRYQLNSVSAANVTVGGALTLPVGKEEVGGDNFDLGGFLAARMPLDNGIVIMGSTGLNLVEMSDRYGGSDRGLSLHLGGGAIFALNPQTHLTAEIGIDTKEDYFALTGGMDHALSATSRLRAALVVGLDDGAPDFGLQGGFLVSF